MNQPRFPRPIDPHPGPKNISPGPQRLAPGPRSVSLGPPLPHPGPKPAPSVSGSQPRVPRSQPLVPASGTSVPRHVRLVPGCPVRNHLKEVCHQCALISHWLNDCTFSKVLRPMTKASIVLMNQMNQKSESSSAVYSGRYSQSMSPFGLAMKPISTGRNKCRVFHVLRLSVVSLESE